MLKPVDRCKLLSERDSKWLDISSDLRFLSGAREFLWTSDRSGFRHIYLYERNGNLIRQLTKGEWVVYKIEGVDERGGWIYYSSNQASVLGRDLYRIKMDGSGEERITGDAGTHGIVMNLQATAQVDSFSSMNRREEIRVSDLASGKKLSCFTPATWMNLIW